MPPIPSIGNRATANTTHSIPPNYCNGCLSYNKLKGHASTRWKIEAPGVVHPEKDSKIAFVTERLDGPIIKKGKTPKVPNKIQKIASSNILHEIALSFLHYEMAILKQNYPLK